MAFIDESSDVPARRGLRPDETWGHRVLIARVAGLQSQLKGGVANLGQAATIWRCKGRFASAAATPS